KLLLSMLFLLTTLPLTAVAGQLREYCVAAEPASWNYAPSGKNLLHPGDDMGSWGERLEYAKYRYVGYTDASYQTPIPQPEWRGILGPELLADVGDTLKVHFRNNADRQCSMHPHGLRDDADNDGADHRGAGASIAPGATFTYTWEVDEEAGPGPTDPSSIVWLYHSHVDHTDDIYQGLIGTIVVTRKGMARSPADPRPRDVDRDFTTLFMVFDEENAEEGGLKRAMNGYIFGKLRGLDA